MTAPDRPGIEFTLTEAFTRRHAAQRATRPSLVDVRRRAHRRSTRNAAVRTGAVVAAGAAVVAGGWAVSRRDSSPAAPAVPVDEVAPSDGSSDQVVATLSVDGLWNAVAAQLGTTVEDLRSANASVDFSRAPVPGTPIVIPVGPLDSAVPPTSPPPTTVVVTAPPTTFLPTTVTGRVIPGTIDTTTTGPVTTDATATTTPPPPPGWRVYRIVTGDYLAAIADRFCTTLDVIVEANRWPAGVNTPLYPDDVVLVPADAC